MDGVLRRARAGALESVMTAQAPTRVLHVVNWLNRGGIECYLMNVLRGAAPAAWRLDFCCKGASVGQMADEARALGSEVHHCRLAPLRGGFAERFRALLRRGRYDVVHSHVADLGGPVLAAAEQEGVPVRLAAYHNTRSASGESALRRLPLLGPLRDAYLRRCRRLVLRHATGLTACSRAAFDAFYPGWESGRYRLPFEVVYYGVDTGRFERLRPRQQVRRELGVEADEALVGHVGRFNAQKDHLGIVRIAAEVVSRRPRTRFLLVGDGPLRPAVERAIGRAGLGGRFILPGVRSDVPDLMGAMDVMLFPSLHEGFGLVILEAQLAGAPVVTSDIPGTREALHEAYRRWACPPRAYGQFARTLLEVLDDPPRAAGLARQARAWAEENFSLAAGLGRLWACYRRCLQGVR